MGTSVHHVRAYAVRKISHPVFEGIEKYWLTVAAKDFPSGISTIRKCPRSDWISIVASIEVRRARSDGESLASFDLMNKGITILANEVRMLNKENGYSISTLMRLGRNRRWCAHCQDHRRIQ